MQCRYCGDAHTNTLSLFCSLDHEQAYESVGRFISIITSNPLPVAGFLVLKEPARAAPKSRRGYPALESRRPPSPELPRYPFPLPQHEVFGPTRRAVAETPPPTPIPEPPPGGIQNPSGFPQENPKGFPSQMPISSSQPSIRTELGDLTMGGTLTTSKPRSQRTEPQSGPPNLHLRTARQAALRLADQRWQAMEIAGVAIEPSEFQPSVEWSNICRLSFEATGFDFTGDIESRKPGKQVADGPIVNVAKVLAEPSADSSRLTPQWRPIEWDQIDDATLVADTPSEITDEGRKLELYLPPAPPKPAKPEPKKEEAKKAPEPAKPAPKKAAEVVLEAIIEEEEDLLPIPPLAAEPAYDRPGMRRPPAPPSFPPPEPVAVTGSRLQMPVFASAPLRNPLVAGPSPEPPKPAVEVKVVEAKPIETPAPPAEVKVVEVKSETRTESKPAARPGKKKKHHKGSSRTSPVDESPSYESIEEPEDLGDDVEAELASTWLPTEAVEPPKPEPAKKEEPKARKEEVKAKEEPRPKPQPQPESTQSPSFGGLASAEPKTSKSNVSGGLGLSSEPEPPPPAGAGMGLKIGIAVGVLAAVGGIAVFTMGGSSDKKASAPTATAAPTIVMQTAGAVMGEAGWQTDYANDAAGKRVRQISFYRPSLQVSDYRAEFEAEIDYKAVSWVVRASTKNYYVLKLQQDGGRVKLFRMLVKDGTPGESKESALPFSTNAGMVFKVRTDVVGKKFKVSVNGSAVDDWTDTTMLSGGFGVANEGAERGQVRAIQLWHLQERTINK